MTLGGNRNTNRQAETASEVLNPDVMFRISSVISMATRSVTERALFVTLQTNAFSSSLQVIPSGQDLSLPQASRKAFLFLPSAFLLLPLHLDVHTWKPGKYNLHLSNSCPIVPMCFLHRPGTFTAGFGTGLMYPKRYCQGRTCVRCLMLRMTLPLRFKPFHGAVRTMALQCSIFILALT